MPYSSLTQSFPSSSSTPENASTLQQRLTTLSSLHNQATTDLAEKDKELRSLQERLSTLAQNSTSLTLTLTKRAEEAERELRWAKEGRQSAERREELAKKEADALRTNSVRPFFARQAIAYGGSESHYAWRSWAFGRRSSSSDISARRTGRDVQSGSRGHIEGLKGCGGCFDAGCGSGQAVYAGRSRKADFSA